MCWTQAALRLRTQKKLEETAWPGGMNSEQVHSQARGADVQPRGGRRGKKAGRVGWLAEPPSGGGKQDESGELGPDEMI